MSARPLTYADREWAFRLATSGFDANRHRWAEHAAAGLTDQQLQETLALQLGIFGGSGGPDQMDVAYQGAGLKIWAAWHVLNTVVEAPIFEGAATIAKAREFYSIRDPGNAQLQLF